MPDTFQRHQPELTTAQRTANSEQGFDELHKLADSHNALKNHNDYTLFEASVVVNNTSNKTIKSVNWNCILVDPASLKVIERFKVQSVERIAPGETRVLKKYLPTPRAKSSAKAVTNQTTTITKIKYARR